MANDTTIVAPEKESRRLLNGSSSVASSSKSYIVKEEEEVYMNGHGAHSDDNVKNGDNSSGDYDDDELTKLNSESLLPGSDALVRQKSATLTPISSDTENNISDCSSNSFKRSYSPGGQNAFINNARNNLRRSFTLPRNLLLRKSGQTGPSTGDQNFLRNIYLTLTRKSTRNKKPQVKVEDVLNGNSEAQLSPDKLQGILLKVLCHYAARNNNYYNISCRASSRLRSGSCRAKESRKHLFYECNPPMYLAY
jgi:hypothetical protein